MVNTILIFNLLMSNKSVSNNFRNEGFGIQISISDLLGVLVELATLFTQSIVIFT